MNQLSRGDVTAASCAARLVVLVTVVIALVAGCSNSGSSAESPVPLAGRSLYFAPLADFSGDTTERLAAFYRGKYGIEATVLEPAPVDPRAWDAERQQLVAEDVITSFKASYPQVVADSGAVIIGIVTQDVYIRERTDWAWAFGLRRDGRFAVVSTARMSWPEGLASDERVASRLRKMVSKNIGLMYFGLSVSSDPASVLYANVGGIDDLDRMGEDF
jgi:predicted Zn-dependent protease